MRWPRMREARLIEPRTVINPKALELQIAKEILAEVFHARPGEVEEMTRRRLEEMSWRSVGKAVACDVLPGGVDVGRRFEGSVRIGGKRVSGS